MDVSVAEVRQVANRLFDHLEQSGYRVMAIPHDFYWQIPRDKRYDPYSQPADLTLGQISFDIAELRRVLSGDAEPVAYHFVWLASILQALGEEVAC
jgi:hypothetical protein